MAFSLCKGGCFETLASVSEVCFVASLPGLVLALSQATYEYGSLQS